MELVSILNLSYLVASILFIVGIKQLAHPKTASRGNLLGALGMFIAVVATLFDQAILTYDWIIVGVLIGSVIGIILAIKIQMTAMPQLVAVLNGFGGIASVFVAGAALQLSIPKYAFAVNYQEIVSIVFSAIVGGITFSGSFIAFGKLQGFITEKAVRYPGDQLVKILVGLTAVGLGVYGCLEPTDESIYWILSGVSLLLGIFLVIPIGGADMPVVISLLNSYSGIAASATGFVLNNNVLIISGSLVGASGIILTQIMCKAMNRSLTNVLFGGFGAVATEMKDDGVFLLW